MSLSLSTPVVNHTNLLVRASEKLLNLSWTTATIESNDRGITYVTTHSLEKTKMSYAATALKVVLLSTILLPVTIMAMVIKVVSRLSNTYVISTLKHDADAVTFERNHLRDQLAQSRAEFEEATTQRKALIADARHLRGAIRAHKLVETAQSRDIEYKKSQLHQLTSQAEATEGLTDQLTQSCAKLEEASTKRDALIADLRHLRGVISEHKAANATQFNEIENQKSQLYQAEAKETELSKKLHEKDAQIESFSLKLENLPEEVQALKKEIEELKADRTPIILEGQLQNANKTIETLKGRLKLLSGNNKDERIAGLETRISGLLSANQSLASDNVQFQKVTKDIINQKDLILTATQEQLQRAVDRLKVIETELTAVKSSNLAFANELANKAIEAVGAELDKTSSDSSGSPLTLSRSSSLSPKLEARDPIFSSVDAHMSVKADFNGLIAAYAGQGANIESILAKIEAGRLLMDQIKNDLEGAKAATLALSAEDQKEQIGNFIWFLMAQAIQEGKGFDEGTFVYQGEGKANFYEFLKTYPEAYQRDQSHWDNRVPVKSRGWGIDCTGAPAHKTHLLFDLLDEDKIFFKPENYGCKTNSDFLSHGLEFFQSLGRFFLPSFFGSNQQEGMRKERVPPYAINGFIRFIVENDILIDKKAHNVLDLAKLYGIGFIKKYLIDHAAKIIAKGHTEEEIAAFVATLPESAYDDQTGNEVFIKDDFVPSWVAESAAAAAAK